jgi:hypothetical protein
MKWVLRVVAAVVVLSVAQALMGALFMRNEPAGPPPGVWLLVSNLLTASVFVGLAARFSVRGGALAFWLFVVMFGIPANYLAETIFFAVGIPLPEVARFYVLELGVRALVAAFVAWSVRGDAPPAAVPPPAPGPGALALCTIAYVVLYFVAGLAVLPYVRDFYATKGPLPSGPLVVLIQLGRGLAFAGVVLVITRFFAASRWGKALTAGVVLSVIGAVAPLVVPNLYMPGYIRFPHLVEAGVSNFVFGVIAGVLLTRRTSKP